MNNFNRRKFLSQTLIGAGGLMVANLPVTKENRETMETNEFKRPKVIFFDVNETLLDLAPLKESVAQALDGKKELVSLWFTTLLQYSLVVTVGEQYRDFSEIGAATLRMVAKNQNINLTEEKARQVLKPMLSLPAHPDVAPALARLKQGGFRLVTLTNSSNKAVEAQMTYSGLKQYFEKLWSVEDISLYKPHLKVYQWASEKMDVKPEECMLVAAHGWDVAGARWAGWQTAFISLPGQQLYPLAEEPEIVAPTLLQVAEKLLALKE